ncbi:50S ribosomal protein L11 methyltransferase [Thiorhodovibrio frisius]|uniref:Ribosomal protein L11 methyltransferase n=1 Tax=Thiorhodovibrio frisius TaxID=631362 RepID=H8YYG9_9GAMM|nr:50S ribosomal protein L11 methyltransferase [Thiorhodovibrio frisius]EIC23495.1 ribosomal protein L11 methyltransferase [Thiorhodovibrio frisius]WPL23418.1 Ribosomal protein L11 methyltransferase [Thiorhodovibrio frisius]
MPWLQLALISAREQVPLIEAVLENAGALAVTLDDPEDCGQTPTQTDLSLLEPAPGAMPLWALVRLTALFEDTPEAGERAQQCAAQLQDALAAPPHLEPLADQVWERAWLAHWQPRRFGRRLWVCPCDQDPATDAAAGIQPDDVILALDPGLAFGTGSHPTTALCLEWLDGLDLTGKTLIDYGCGSGILAIAALKLGAAHAIAIDHDPQALIATAANAANNGVAARLSCHSPEDFAAKTRPRPQADVLVANILAGILIELAPQLSRLCAPGAQVALSGILDPQVPAVCAAYGAHLVLSEPILRDQWALLSGHSAQTA